MWEAFNDICKRRCTHSVSAGLTSLIESIELWYYNATDSVMRLTKYQHADEKQTCGSMCGPRSDTAGRF